MKSHFVIASAFLLISIFSLSHAADEDCAKAYKPATKKIEHYFNMQVGSNKLFNPDYSTLSTNQCPFERPYRCKPGSMQSYNNGDFSYPVVSGLYAVIPSDTSMTMFIGQQLDGIYSLEDASKVIFNQSGFKQGQDARMSSSRPSYSFLNSERIVLFGRPIKVSIKIRALKEYSGSLDRTIVDYEIVDDSVSCPQAVAPNLKTTNETPSGVKQSVSNYGGMLCKRYYPGYVGKTNGKASSLADKVPFVVRYVNAKQNNVTVEWTDNGWGIKKGELREFDCETLQLNE